MKKQINATHLADAIKNSNVEQAKFRVGYYYSNGFGEISNQKEWLVDFKGLRDVFNDSIMEHIERWLRGDRFEIEFEIESEDESLDESLDVYITTSGGRIIIEYIEKYRAGGYDDNPVYRYNRDLYEITKDSE